MTGPLADGLILMRQGMALLDGIGAHMDRPYLLALLSEITAENGQPSEALEQITEALGRLRESRAYFYEAELYRLRGALILQTSGRQERMKPKRISARPCKSRSSKKRRHLNCVPR